MKQMQLNNFPAYVTVREMLDSVSVKFRGKVAYSYPPQVLSVYTIVKTDGN